MIVVVPMLTKNVLRPVGLALTGIGCLILIMALVVLEAHRARRGHRTVFDVIEDLENSEL